MKSLIFLLISILPLQENLVPVPIVMEIGEPVQVTYLESDSAELVESEDKTLIIAEGLSTDQKQGVIIPITNPTESYIVAFKLIDYNGTKLAQFPPLIIEHVKGLPEKFLIPGEPGDEFGIQIPGSNPPAYLTVLVDGPQSPPIPPPGNGLTQEDLSELAQLIVVSRNNLSDPISQQEIKLELSSLLSSLPDSLDEAELAYNRAVSNGLINAANKLDPPYKDWRGLFREPIKNWYDSKKNKITDTTQFQKFVQTVVDNF